MEAPPILTVYEGEGIWRPANAYAARIADKHYVIGERYPLVEFHQRSHASHGHYFAAVHSAWLNLPDAMMADFPTGDHLRKYALIKTGFCDNEKFVAKTNGEARKLAAFIRPIDEYSIIEVDGRVVTRTMAKSQSMKAMGKADFQRSKEAVLELLASIVGTSSKELSTNAAA